MVVLRPLIRKIIKSVFNTASSFNQFWNSKILQNEPIFNGVYSRDNLPRIKDGTYVINLDEYSDIGTHWVALWLYNNDVTYFDSFGVAHILKEIKKFIKNKNIKTNIFRIQANDSIMCGYFCIGFINFRLKGKSLLDYTIYFLLMNLKRMIK